MSIQESIAKVQQQIEQACHTAFSNKGRDKEQVTLIAVSKTKPVWALQEAYDAGMRHFGENKVQEIMDKYDQLPQDIHWHLIGHLQTNKVKYIVDKVYMIHSLDSYHLAETIEKECAKKDCIMQVLVQVNVSMEDTKFGVSMEETEGLIRQIAQFPHLRVRGLMTVAPFVDDSEKNRPVFSKLYKLFLDIKEKNIDNVTMNVLSMGMSGDFPVAVQEGATMVRVGTSIFGARDYR